MSNPELPIKFTDAAAKKVLSLITEEENPNLKLRVYVTGGGCSGFQYGFTFDEKINDGDMTIEKQGVYTTNGDGEHETPLVNGAECAYVVFDKTGTLTQGKFGVRSVISFSSMSEKEMLSLAAAIERFSSHVIGNAIVQHEAGHSTQNKKVTDVKNEAGKGITARVGDTSYAVGNEALMRERRVWSAKVQTEGEKHISRGETVVYVADTTQILGLITLADTIKPESYAAIKNLHALGVRVAMLTGDNEGVARGVARELSIDTYRAGVLPEDKYRFVKELQEKGHTVLMVGDGVNDAPALAQADAGIAIGAGTDVAVEAGDIVLTRNNPLDIVRLVKLARAVYGKMLQNLAWALGYNIVAIPAAAGVFAAWGFFLRPEVGALLMSLSTVIVVINALALRKIDLRVAGEPATS